MTVCTCIGVFVEISNSLLLVEITGWLKIQGVTSQKT